MEADKDWFSGESMVYILVSVLFCIISIISITKPYQAVLCVYVGLVALLLGVSYKARAHRLLYMLYKNLFQL